MPASPETYVIASGEPLGAGRFIAPSISGGIWTPDRDAAGNVLRGNWLGLPLHSWVEVSGQVMNDVIQTPHYNGNGYDGASGIIGVWNGAAYDYVNKRMYLAGGGHGGTSACETGIYKIDIPSLSLSRIRDRDPMDMLQTYNATTDQMDVGVDHFEPWNDPLINGTPGATHTYNGLLWVPPSVLGNTNGGVFYLGRAKAIWNLDTHEWTTTHWHKPTRSGVEVDWSNSTAFLDGSAIYGVGYSPYHYRFDLTQTQATDWSPTSYGKLEPQWKWADRSIGTGHWYWMRERRETVSLYTNGTARRVRYGQALDANAANWSAYIDDITLTSADGSHADFSSANMTGDSPLGAPGFSLDDDTDTLYIQGNFIGSPLYRMTGLNTNTWTVEMIAGTGALTKSQNGTYTRLRLVEMFDHKFLVRIASTTTPIEVMRLN